jgi:transcriptional repressor NrdR
MIRELELKWGNLNEITAKQIGADILEVLFQLDDVAYIRYASIHLDFSTGKDFLNFLSNKL